MINTSELTDQKTIIFPSEEHLILSKSGEVVSLENVPLKKLEEVKELVQKHLVKGENEYINNITLARVNKAIATEKDLIEKAQTFSKYSFGSEGKSYFPAYN